MTTTPDKVDSALLSEQERPLMGMFSASGIEPMSDDEVRLWKDELRELVNDGIRQDVES